MSDTQTKHRLAAILAADAVGYSRLMSADDRATVAALDAARAVFRNHIQANQGRVVDMAGDSVLAVFETAAGAVSAALATQRELEANVGEIPTDQRLLFRIGVHMGDVIEKADGTIYGDGVNIAARLQSLAPAGGAVISEAVRGSVKNRVAAHFVDLGAQSVKNISEPVRAFQVQGADSKRIPTAAKSRTGSWAVVALSIVGAVIVGAGWYAIHSGMLQSKPERADAKSIAVLPFANISDDKDTAYFADGVHEDLLTQLALLGDLKVISRVSVMDYRNTKKNVRQIGSELGVASVVEGSVRRAGNQVRVTAQLIDARSDTHLWAKTYDRELKDIFAIQTELATEIAKSLKVSLEPEASQRLAKRPTNNLEAYDLFLRHRELVHQTAGSIRTISSVVERIDLLSKAVALDPDFALAWAQLAAEHGRSYFMGVDRSRGRLELADAAFRRAQALAPEDLLVKIEAGAYYVYARPDPQRAAKAYEEVLAVAPNNVNALVGLANVRLREMQFGERAALLERALALDPRNPATLNYLGNQYRDFRQYDRALALFQQLDNLRPGDYDIPAKWHELEYVRSGSWDSYDSWRKTLPAGAESKSSRVRFADIDRAVARRDFDEALRLLGTKSDDLKPVEDNADRLSDEMARAVLLRAKGDKAQALKVAQAAMAKVEVELNTTGDPSGLLQTKSYLHAILGERDAAFATLARRVALRRDKGDVRLAEIEQRDRLQLLALLNDHSGALAELERQLKLPEAFANTYRIDPSLASLWDDPKFQAIVDNPANNAPLSFDTKYGLLPDK